jgi:hypothetical protein
MFFSDLQQSEPPDFVGVSVWAADYFWHFRALQLKTMVCGAII